MNQVFSLFLIYVFRFLVLVVSYFSLTKFYFFFLLFTIFGFHCEINDSFLHLFSQKIVLFTLYSALFLSFLLNVPFFGKKIQFFLGISFLDKYLPGHFKAVLFFAWLLFTVVFLNYIDALSLSNKMLEYDQIVKGMEDSFANMPEKGWDKDFLESDVFKKLPKEYPSTGIITDFSNTVITYLEGKK